MVGLNLSLHLGSQGLPKRGQVISRPLSSGARPTVPKPPLSLGTGLIEPFEGQPWKFGQIPFRPSKHLPCVRHHRPHGLLDIALFASDSFRHISAKELHVLSFRQGHRNLPVEFPHGPCDPSPRVRHLPRFHRSLAWELKPRAKVGSDLIHGSPTLPFHLGALLFHHPSQQLGQPFATSLLVEDV